MKCQQAHVFLSPYLDSELDPTTTYEVSRHLEGCPDCAQLFGAEEVLERTIGEQLRLPEGDEQELIERGLSNLFAHRRRFVGRRAFLTAASVILLLGLLAHRMTTGESRRVPALISMAADDHHRYILGELTPEFLTHDASALAAFFEGRLAGEIGALPSGNGWELEGARVCRFEGSPVGFVTLRYHGIPVSVVDVPTVDGKSAPGDSSASTVADRGFELQGGRGILRRTAAGLRVAFGDVEMAKLEEVIQAAR